MFERGMRNTGIKHLPVVQTAGQSERTDKFKDDADSSDETCNNTLWMSGWHVSQHVSSISVGSMVPVDTLDTRQLPSGPSSPAMTALVLPQELGNDDWTG